jgi:hypothetical protein
MEGADVIAESITPLWSDETLAERALQMGKVQNLRQACRALDGLFIPAGSVFSFWRCVGPPLRARGYVPGRMLQQGCMMAAVGGGLCQLSNALYDAALQSGCRIVERHAHSRIVPGSAAALDRDATVAWNYVDLRFASHRPLRLVARLDRDSLIVRMLGRAEAPAARSPEPSRRAPLSAARSCASCAETDCLSHEHGAPPPPSDRRLFMVDEAWPEFQDHVQATRQPGDGLALPLDGARLGVARYSWRTQGFTRPASTPLAAVSRALALRRAGLQGRQRRLAELVAAGRIASALARGLRPEITAVIVAQSYLPFLWRDGHLGGRRVSVLMTRLPMAMLQARLDAQAAAHPDRPTLADFRAPAWLAETEAEALAGADQIITPHAEIAALFPGRAVHLSWRRPRMDRAEPSSYRRVVFPGPTVARKGAHAVRAAALALDLEVMLLGGELEGPDFWRGVRTAPAGDWTSAAALVQPAIVEDQPRRLLAALAAGVPVIATSASGIDPQPGLILVPPDDAEALTEALRSLMEPSNRAVRRISAPAIRS